MKKIINIIIILMLTSAIFLFADDAGAAKKDEKKFPGVFGAEFEQDFQMDTIGNKPATNYGWSDVYLKSRGKGQLAFTFNFVDKAKQSFGSYTIMPWVQDAVELPMFFGNGIPVTINTKNNFYVGMDNTFAFDKIMTVDIGYEFRLGSALGLNPVSYGSEQITGMEVRLSPFVNLSGSYDIGISWNVSQYFEFYFFPGLGNLIDTTSANLASYKNMQFTEFEGNYNLSFEFLHFIKGNEKIKASIYTELYLWARALDEGHYVLNYFTNGNLIRSLDPAVGMTFDIYGFQPFLYYFVHSFGNSKDNRLTGSWVGIKGGLGYTKDWFSVNIIYYGMINSDPNSTDNKWMNHIETYFKITI